MQKSPVERLAWSHEARLAWRRSAGKQPAEAAPVRRRREEGALLPAELKREATFGRPAVVGRPRHAATARSPLHGRDSADGTCSGVTPPKLGEPRRTLRGAISPVPRQHEANSTGGRPSKARVGPGYSAPRGGRNLKGSRQGKQRNVDGMKIQRLRASFSAATLCSRPAAELALDSGYAPSRMYASAYTFDTKAFALPHQCPQGVPRVVANKCDAD